MCCWSVCPCRPTPTAHRSRKRPNGKHSSIIVRELGMTSGWSTLIVSQNVGPHGPPTSTQVVDGAKTWRTYLGKLGTAAGAQLTSCSHRKTRTAMTPLSRWCSSHRSSMQPWTLCNKRNTMHHACLICRTLTNHNWGHSSGGR